MKPVSTRYSQTTIRHIAKAFCTGSNIQERHTNTKQKSQELVCSPTNDRNDIETPIFQINHISPVKLEICGLILQTYNSAQNIPKLIILSNN